jgi:hypothetical protein
MLAFCGCNSEISDASDSSAESSVVVRVVKVKEDSAKGDFLGITKLEVVELDEKTLPEGYFSKTTDIVGRELLQDVKAGDIITESMLAKKAAEKEPEEEINEETARGKGYVVVTDYIRSNAHKDVSAEIQKIIDENPQATIYFPDGEYQIAKPIVTSSDPKKAVSLRLSTFAIIKATQDWDDANGYMIQLGGKDKTFTVDEVGSNYYMEGGCIDGSFKAKGVEVAGGLETSVRYVSIKFVTQGIHIALNEESESSYADIETVNIVGCRQPESVGVLVDSNGNTFTNMRVAGFEVATKANGKNNIFRNLHMLYTYSGNYDYRNSVGFWDTSEGNTYDICYPDNFAIGFRTSGHTMSVYNNCYAYWYSKNQGEMQYGFSSDGKFNSVLKNYRVDLTDYKDGRFMIVAEDGGNGIVEYPAFPENACDDDTYKDYLVGKVVWMG